MFGIEVIKAVKFSPISEEEIAQMIKDKIAEAHPDVVITDLKFSKTQKQGVQVIITGELADGSPEPAKAVKPKAKKAPIELPEADDVPEEIEPEVSRDGVVSLTEQEQQQSDLIDEVLAEEANDEDVPLETAETTEPEAEEQTKNVKSLAEMFQSV